MKPDSKPGLLAMWGFLVSVPFATYLSGVAQSLMRGHTLVHIGAMQSLRSLVIPIAGMVSAG